MGQVVISDLKPIPQETYLSEDIVHLAQYFLGKYLVSQIDQKTCVGRIVETEAYRAPDDKGSHAHGNKRTKRTEVMFANGGQSYVYLCYGIHSMLNIVSAPKDTAHAILIRALEPVIGLDIMTERRGCISGYALTNGPGKVCQALGISRDHNDMPLHKKSSPIWIGDNEAISQSQIVKGPRVGIAYAQECAYWDWRFTIKDNPWTSKPDVVQYSH